MNKKILSLTTVGVLLHSTPSLACAPVFTESAGVGYKGGYEYHLEYSQRERGNQTQNLLTTRLDYGITPDWMIAAEVTPYKRVEQNGLDNDGVGNVGFLTKYRVYLDATADYQRSATILGRVNLDTASDAQPALSSGTEEYEVGLALRQESNKWQYWSSARYRFNGTGTVGIDQGSKLRLDAAIGLRPEPLESINENDTVWLLEVNGEFADKSDQYGASLTNTGGSEVFISPGVYWSHRNVGLKGGVQIPVYSDLNGIQDESDYRAKVALEIIF